MRKSEARRFQSANCQDCKFADQRRLKLGSPCCTYPGQIETSDGKCLMQQQ